MIGQEGKWLGCGLDPLPKRGTDQPLAKTLQPGHSSILKTDITHVRDTPLSVCLGDSRLWGCRPREAKDVSIQRSVLAYSQQLYSQQPKLDTTDAHSRGRTCSVTSGSGTTAKGHRDEHGSACAFGRLSAAPGIGSSWMRRAPLEVGGQLLGSHQSPLPLKNTRAQTNFSSPRLA